MAGDRPFPKGARLSGADIDTLKDWLCERAPPELVLAGAYTVDDLTDDLVSIINGMVSDDIDARGEDA